MKMKASQFFMILFIYTRLYINNIIKHCLAFIIIIISIYFYFYKIN